MPRWEYCTVVSDHARASTIYHTRNGGVAVAVPEDAGGGDVGADLAWSRHLTALGAEGWELVGIDHPSPGTVALHFKRPLPE